MFNLKFQAMEGARDVAVAIMREINDLMEDVNNFKIREVLLFKNTFTFLYIN